MIRSAEKIPRLRTRGRANRARMLREAERLLSAGDPEPLRFSDVFEAAGVSRGSAYRIYIGMDDLLQDLAGEWVHNFVDYLDEEMPEKQPASWMELSDYIVERAGRYWTETADTLKAMPRIRSSSQASHKAAVTALSECIAGLFDRHFIVPRIPDWQLKIGFYTQLCDVAFSDAVRTHGRIDSARVAEAQAVCRAQLSFYLPPDLPAR